MSFARYMLIAHLIVRGAHLIYFGTSNKILFLTAVAQYQSRFVLVVFAYITIVIFPNVRIRASKLSAFCARFATDITLINCNFGLSICASWPKIPDSAHGSL
jgi:hypothetical protein